VTVVEFDQCGAHGGGAPIKSFLAAQWSDRRGWTRFRTGPRP